MSEHVAMGRVCPHCNLSLARYEDPEAVRIIAQLERESDALRKECIEWKSHAAQSDHEFLEMSDWLIGNAEFDLKTGLIDHAKKLKERIRDLISIEGEAGDLKEQLAAAQKEISELKSANLQANAAIGDIANECKGYVAQIEELKRDKERLDWLSIVDWKADVFQKSPKPFWITLTGGKYNPKTYLELREAIDAAVAQSNRSAAENFANNVAMEAKGAS